MIEEIFSQPINSNKIYDLSYNLYDSGKVSLHEKSFFIVMDYKYIKYIFY